LDSEVLKKYIFGGHVAEYMESLEEEEDKHFKKQLATYLSADAHPSSQSVRSQPYAGAPFHREDPSFKPTDKSKDWKSESTKLMDPKLTRARRKERIAAKI
ncbi:ribosomal L18 C-terminal region-domain-containing protein, partial [Mycena vulgaris]